MIIDRIREEMSVIAADDHCIGFVCRLEGNEQLRITCISAGYGYDHLIPLSWVNEVDKFVFLDKTSSFVAANWANAPLPTRKAAITASKAREMLGGAEVARPKAA